MKKLNKKNNKVTETKQGMKSIFHRNTGDMEFFTTSYRLEYQQDSNLIRVNADSPYSSRVLKAKLEDNFYCEKKYVSKSSALKSLDKIKNGYKWHITGSSWKRNFRVVEVKTYSYMTSELVEGKMITNYLSISELRTIIAKEI